MVWKKREEGKVQRAKQLKEKASKIEKEKQKGKKELKSDLQNVFYK